MFEEDHKNPRDLAIYKKAKEIFETVQIIGDLIPKEDDQLNLVKDIMFENAMILCPKIEGAEVAGFYDLKMENATLIRKAARELMIQNHSLDHLGFEQIAYFSIIRNQIEEFRLLFIDWVNSFDQWDYVIDRWGLFNPPGVGPFDKDPDDDIPINPNEWF